MNLINISTNSTFINNSKVLYKIISMTSKNNLLELKVQIEKFIKKIITQNSKRRNMSDEESEKPVFTGPLFKKPTKK